jgi:Tol biopolymer transport system component
MENGLLGLYIMLASGGKSLPLAVSDQGHKEGPCWSPDGKRIAYSDGKGDIWIIDLKPGRLISELQVLNEQSQR